MGAALLQLRDNKGMGRHTHLHGVMGTQAAISHADIGLFSAAKPSCPSVQTGDLCCSPAILPASVSCHCSTVRSPSSRQIVTSASTRRSAIAALCPGVG